MATITKSISEKWNKRIENYLTEILVDEMERTFPLREFTPDILMEDAPEKSYEGFWCWINGGKILRLSIPVSYCLSTGYLYKPLQKAIDELDEDAYKFATETIGERTDENSDDFFEAFDNYLEDAYIDIEVSIKLYEKDNDRNPFYGADAFRCDAYASIGRKQVELLQEEKLTAANLKNCIKKATEFICQ